MTIRLPAMANWLSASELKPLVITWNPTFRVRALSLRARRKNAGTAGYVKFLQRSYRQKDARHGVFLITRSLSGVFVWIPAFAGMTPMMGDAR